MASIHNAARTTAHQLVLDWYATRRSDPPALHELDPAALQAAIAGAIRAAVNAEREACTRLLATQDSRYSFWNGTQENVHGSKCAALIRRRHHAVDHNH